MSEPVVPTDLIPPTDAPPAPPPRKSRAPRATRQHWAQRLQRFRTSGLTVAAFCAQEGVSVPAFYGATRALRAQARAEAPAPEPSELIPLRLAPGAPTLELVLPSGALLRLGADLDPARLAALLRAVGAIPC
jgi:hypothetical protein